MVDYDIAEILGLILARETFNDLWKNCFWRNPQKKLRKKRRRRQ